MVVIPFHKGSNAERSRYRNRQAVLDRVRTAGTIGRAEIARALSLTTQTVSNIIAELQSDGLLLEKGRLSAGRGLPAIQYALNPEGGFALGIEVRPDAIFTALLDMEGTARTTQRIALTQASPGAVLGHVKALYGDMLAAFPAAQGRMLGAGVVMPGPFGVTGIAGLGSDLIGWQEVDATGLFSDALGLPVMLSNDANAAAIAERINGVAQDISSFVYLYFGAGLGLGHIHQGQLVSGAHGNAGEIGHVPVGAQGRKLEDALSRISVQRHLQAAGKQADSIDALDRLFQADDPDLAVWLRAASTALAQAMSIVENLYDPQTVVLGGAMPDAILDHLIAHAPLSGLSVSNRPGAPLPRLMRGMSGRMTATLGAAALILNRSLSDPLRISH